MLAFIALVLLVYAIAAFVDAVIGKLLIWAIAWAVIAVICILTLGVGVHVHV